MSMALSTPWVSFDGKNCAGCKHLNDRGYCEFTACIIPCTVQATIPQDKPQTNYDRLISKTPEELAEFLCANVSPEGTINCGTCRAQEFCRMGHNGWLDWLRQEAET